MRSEVALQVEKGVLHHVLGFVTCEAKTDKIPEQRLAQSRYRVVTSEVPAASAAGAEPGVRNRDSLGPPHRASVYRTTERPRFSGRVFRHREPLPLFHRFGFETPMNGECDVRRGMRL